MQNTKMYHHPIFKFDTQLQHSDTSPNDLKIEKLNFKPNLLKVEDDKSSNSWSAAHQFLDSEEAKGNFRKLCLIMNQ